MRWREWVCVTGIALVACGDPTPPVGRPPAAVPDGGLTGPPVAEPAASMLPTPPALGWSAAEPDIAPPDEATCPAEHAWTADPSGAMICRPILVGTTECPVGTARLVGAFGCEPLGDACPSGSFPAVPSDRAALYVQAGAIGGDGTEAAPYGTLNDAIAAAPDGAVIAVAAGVYAESLTLGRDLTLLGACARDVVIAPPGDGLPREAAVRVTGVAEVRNVRIEETDRIGVRVDGEGAAATLHGVEIAAAKSGGLLVHFGAHVTVTELMVRYTRPSDGGALGWGVSFESGASGSIEDAVIARNYGAGVSVVGSELTLRRVLVRDTAPRASDGSLGRGVQVEDGATLRIEGLVVERAAEFGLLAAGLDTRVSGGGLFVGGTVANGASPSGAGIGIERSAAVELDGLTAIGNQSAGVSLRAGGSLTARDVVVLDTLANEVDGAPGVGLWATTESTLTASRVVLGRNAGGQLVATDARTTIDVSDLLAFGPLDGGGPADGAGVGLRVESGADALIRRAVVRDAVGLAIGVRDAAASLDDVAVVRVHERADGGSEGGIVVDEDAFVDARRVRVTEAFGAAIAIASGGVLDLEDLHVEHTDGERDGVAGRVGLRVDGGELVVRRARIHHGAQVAILVRSDGASARLTDVAVTLGGAANPEHQRSAGLAVLDGASADVERLAVDRDGDFGLYITGAGARLDADDLTLTDAADPSGLGRGAVAVTVSAGASARGARWSMEGPGQIGLAVDGEDSHAVVSDLSIYAVGPVRSGATVTPTPAAIAVGGGARLEAERVAVRYVLGVGVATFGDGSTVTLGDAELSLTLPPGCLRGWPCEIGGEGGVGVVSYAGATVGLDAFRILETGRCAVQIAEGGGVDLSHGLVHRAPRGACVHDPSFSLRRLNDEVLWIEVAEVATRDDHPIPEVPSIPALE